MLDNLFYGKFDADEILSTMSETLIKMGVAMMNMEIDDCDIMSRLSDSRFHLLNTVDEDEIENLLSGDEAEQFALDNYVRTYKRVFKVDDPHNSVQVRDNILEGCSIWEIPFKSLHLTKSEIGSMVRSDISRYKASVESFRRLASQV